MGGGRGGQRPFRNFPEIHPFWWRQASLIEEVEKSLKLCPSLMFLFAQTITFYMFSPIALSPHYLCIAGGRGWEGKEELEKTSSASGLEKGGGCPDVCVVSW